MDGDGGGARDEALVGFRVECRAGCGVELRVKRQGWEAEQGHGEWSAGREAEQGHGG